MDRRLLGFVLCIAAGAGFGSGPLFAKVVYAQSDTGFLTLMLWRFLVASAVLWLLNLASPARRAAVRATSRRTVAVGIALGVLYCVSSGAYYAGLETVPASLAALIVFITPPVNAVLSLRFGRRLQGGRAWLALLLALVGGVLTVGGIPADAMPPLGSLLLIVLGPFTFSIWILAQALLTGERADAASSARDDADPIVLAALMSSGTLAAYFVVVTVAGAPYVTPTPEPFVWAMVVALGLSSTFAIVAFAAGTQIIGAATASLLSTVEPTWTIAMSALLLGESLTVVQLAGGALIVGGVLLAHSRRGDPEARLLVRIAEE